MNTTGYRKRTTGLLFLLLLVHFWLGQTFELSGREAYLWLLGHGANLDWCYFDCGALTPWLIRLGTVFFGNTELGVRWIAAVIYASSGFMVFWCARRWFTPSVAFSTLLLYIVTPLYNWELLKLNEATVSLGLMALALAAYREALDRNDWRWHIAAGVISGLAVHALWFNALWPLGLLLACAIDPQRRKLLGHWQHWLMPLTVAIVSIPIFLWYRRPEMEGLSQLHPLPVDAGSHSFSLGAGALFLWIQLLSMAIGYWVFLMLLSGLGKRPVFRDSRYTLLLCVSLPGLLIQSVASLFHLDNPATLPALYLPLLFVIGNVWSELGQESRQWKWLGALWLLAAAGISLCGLIPAIAQSGHLRGAPYSAYSYRALADEMARLMQEKGASVAVAEDAITASALTFYLPRQQMAYVIAGHGVRSQFDFWPNYSDFNGYNFILVTGGNRLAPAVFTSAFAKVVPLPEAQVPGSGLAGWRFYYCENFQVGATGALQPIPPEAARELESSTPLPKR